MPDLRSIFTSYLDVHSLPLVLVNDKTFIIQQAKAEEQRRVLWDLSFVT